MSDVSPLDPSVAREYAAGATPGGHYPGGSGSVSWLGSADSLADVDERFERLEDRRRLNRAMARWRESPEYKKARKTADVFIRGGTAVAALAIAGALTVWALGLGSRYAVAGVVAGLIIALLCFGLARYTLVTASRDVVVDDEPRQSPKVTSKWLQDPDLQNLITLNRAQMQVYHELATNQATYAARNSRRAMLVGFLLLVTGGIVALRATDDTSKIVAGTLAGLGSLLSGYIGQTFLKAEDRAMEQLNFYFQQPLVTSYMLAAERLTLKLTDVKRDAVLTDVIKQVLGAARTTEAAGNVAKPSRHRAAKKAAPVGPVAGQS